MSLIKRITLLVLFAITASVNAKSLHIYNVKGYTFTPQRELVTFTNMVIDSGKVVSIGDDSLGHAFPTAQQLDGEGQTLLPGLIDAHGHLLGLGASLLFIDVREATSAQHAAKMAADYYQRNPDLTWVQGGRWNQVLWPDKEFPNAAILDETLPNVPVWLERIDGHAGWANSAALKIAGITKETVSPEGGKILTDELGNPTGILIDTAMSLVEKHLPEQNRQLMQQQLNAAGEHLLSLGITSMHDAGIDKRTYDFYRELAADGELPLRVYAMLAATAPELPQMLAAGKVTTADEMLLIRSVKAYGDGALGSRGAALLAAYNDDPRNKGLLVTAQDKLPGLFNQVIGSGFALHFHAIGDRANRLALDQFAATFATIGGQELRHRMEHAQVIAVDDIIRFKELDIIPSMQPTHATSDMNMARDRIGPKRLRGAYAWRTFLKQGSILAFGSDFPVELANPFYGLHAAVTRQDRNNQPVKGWIPEQALSLTESLRAFTIDAAYAAAQEQTIGSLTKGYWADFILVDKDIFAIPAEDLWTVTVNQTFIAGEKVYQRD
ncbi:amidohydrolase [Alteromonas sp. ASW11-36]|uniref:Amidohydrolase n=1 Tax=Alteromonas arenosi TaxID=3055817 RepID=A0ABT7T0Y2_9ALTE|nr:amidohydrolase [Alteromonas sp. ASW11-36]MDM7861464.1 amidohydrolase [Alteromonas sp. ASW11-36]